MNASHPRARQPVAYLPVNAVTDRRLPSNLKETLPLAAQYEHLLQAEAKLDAAMTRKIYDMQDGMARSPQVARTLRIWCSNTAHDQAWQVTAAAAGAHADSGGMDVDDAPPFDFESDRVPSWTLRLVGEIVPDARYDDSVVPVPLFTDLVRSVCIEEVLDRHGYAVGGTDDAPILDYQRPSTLPGSQHRTSSLPGIELNRKGDCDVALRISLTLEAAPERYKLQADMASLLHVEEATRQEIMTRIWDYVQAEKLQDSEEKRLIHADTALTRIFGQERLFFPDLPKALNRLLLPLDPIVLPYTVITSQPRTTAPMCWDVQVMLESPLAPLYLDRLAAVHEHDAAIEDLNHEIAATIVGISDSVSKRDFFESYAQSPGTFINAWLASQNYDLEVMLGDVNRVSGEQARRADFYRGDKDWLRESLFHYLAEPRPV